MRLDSGAYEIHEWDLVELNILCNFLTKSLYNSLHLMFLINNSGLTGRFAWIHIGLVMFTMSSSEYYFKLFIQLKTFSPRKWIKKSSCLYHQFSKNSVWLKKERTLTKPNLNASGVNISLPSKRNQSSKNLYYLSMSYVRNCHLFQNSAILCVLNGYCHLYFSQYILSKFSTT